MNLRAASLRVRFPTIAAMAATALKALKMLLLVLLGRRRCCRGAGAIAAGLLLLRCRITHDRGLQP